MNIRNRILWFRDMYFLTSMHPDIYSFCRNSIEDNKDKFPETYAGLTDPYGKQRIDIVGKTVNSSYRRIFREVHVSPRMFSFSLSLIFHFFTLLIDKREVREQAQLRKSPQFTRAAFQRNQRLDMHGLQGQPLTLPQTTWSVADRIAITSFCRFIASGVDDCLDVGNFNCIIRAATFFLYILHCDAFGTLARTLIRSLQTLLHLPLTADLTS